MDRLPSEVVTPRLYLRLWRPDDVPVLRAAIEASLDHLRPWLAWIPSEPLSDEDRTRLVESGRSLWEKGGEANYGVFHNGVVVGGCGLHRRQGPDTLDLGYWIHAEHVRRGYATELARGLTTAAFEVEGVERVEIHHDKANVASEGVPRALGFARGPDKQDRIGAPGEIGIDCSWSISRSGWATAKAPTPT
jgi:RimJ/RimL family protein N-acetyltransferase